MPKAEYPILQFDGGENSDADPRDLERGESALLRGFYADRKGMLRPAGGMLGDSSVPASKLGGLLSVDLDNATPMARLLGHDGTSVANAPASLSLTTTRPVLSFFDGGIHIADGTLGANAAKRMYYRIQDRQAIGGSDGLPGSWTEVDIANPMTPTPARVAVSSDEAGRAISIGTAGNTMYEIGPGPDEVIEFFNMSSVSLEVFIFYHPNQNIVVEDNPGTGNIVIWIPWNGSTTPSASTLVNAINTQSKMLSAALGPDGLSYTGGGNFALIEANIGIPIGSGNTTLGKTDNFDNGTGTLWYYSTPSYTSFVMRNRGVSGRTFASPTSAAPVVTVNGNEFQITDAPTHFKGDIFEFVPNAAGCVSVHFSSEKDDDAVLPTTTVQFAISYVYHGHFDTAPVPQGIGVKLYGNYGYNATAMIHTNGIPNGVDVVRVWARDGERSDWLLFCEFDLAKGYRFFSQADWQSLSASGITHVMQTGPVRVNEFGSATYRSVNGYDPKDSIGATYRAAAFAAGRMFAFGIRQNGKIDTDRVIVSPAGKPGLLPEKNFIVFSTEDGDQYNVAEAVGDRIMAFKNRKAYVIDVSGNEPSTYYVAGEYEGMGIEDRNQIARTDMGLFFINSNGMYVWDGQQKPVSLIQGKIEHWWRANYPVDIDLKPVNAKVSVGFSPLARKVIAILDDITAVFDMNTQGFSIIENPAHAAILANMQWTGSDLVMGRTGTTGMKYSDVSIIQPKAKLRTVFITNNVPGSRKKLKRIQVTFNRALITGEPAKLRLTYKLDSKTEVPIAGTALVQLNVGTGLSAYQHVISPSETCYSVQVGLENINDTSGNEWPADLNILDISVIYKPKRPK
jgi:hypothetical protein